MTRLRAQFVFYALLSTSILQPTPAVAQTPPYNWGPCITNSGACNSNYYATTPPDVCANTMAYYGGCSGNHIVSLEPGPYVLFGVTYYRWACVWDYNDNHSLGCTGGPFTGTILP